MTLREMQSRINALVAEHDADFARNPTRDKVGNRNELPVKFVYQTYTPTGRLRRDTQAYGVRCVYSAAFTTETDGHHIRIVGDEKTDGRTFGK